MQKLYQNIKFSQFGDSRGNLTAIELTDDVVPFNVKRIYYVHGTKTGVSRGFHAHKNLQQVIIAISGSFELRLRDDKSYESIKLSNPSEGILISSCVWREMHNLSNDCVILVLASEPYIETDYIREYDAYIDYLKSLKC